MLLPRQIQPASTRKLFYWVNIIFNTVDKSRLRTVGPNRLCAEWVLKNGGAVRFCESPKILHNDYNLLPPESSTVTVKEIDASNSAVMTMGFAHLEGCAKVDRIILGNCKYADNRGMKYLALAKETLRELEISQCPNVNDSGLLQLSSLTKLQKLVLRDLQGVKDLPGIEQQLKIHLKDCQFQVTPT